jgi:hypothetical protein
MLNQALVTYVNCICGVYGVRGTYGSVTRKSIRTSAEEDMFIYEKEEYV